MNIIWDVFVVIGIIAVIYLIILVCKNWNLAYKDKSIY